MSSTQIDSLIQERFRYRRRDSCRYRTRWPRSRRCSWSPRDQPSRGHRPRASASTSQDVTDRASATAMQSRSGLDRPTSRRARSAHDRAALCRVRPQLSRDRAPSQVVRRRIGDAGYRRLSAAGHAIRDRGRARRRLHGRSGHVYSARTDRVCTAARRSGRQSDALRHDAGVPDALRVGSR